MHYLKFKFQAIISNTNNNAQSFITPHVHAFTYSSIFYKAYLIFPPNFKIALFLFPHRKA